MIRDAPRVSFQQHSVSISGIFRRFRRPLAVGCKDDSAVDAELRFARGQPAHELVRKLTILYDQRLRDNPTIENPHHGVNDWNGDLPQRPGLALLGASGDLLHAPF